MKKCFVFATLTVATLLLSGCASTGALSAEEQKANGKKKLVQVARQFSNLKAMGVHEVRCEQSLDFISGGEVDTNTNKISMKIDHVESMPDFDVTYAEELKIAQNNSENANKVHLEMQARLADYQDFASLLKSLYVINPIHAFPSTRFGVREKDIMFNYSAKGLPGVGYMSVDGEYVTTLLDGLETIAVYKKIDQYNLVQTIVTNREENGVTKGNMLQIDYDMLEGVPVPKTLSLYQHETGKNDQLVGKIESSFCAVEKVTEVVPLQSEVSGQ